MSLYALQKVMYDIDRDPSRQRQFAEDFEGLLNNYELTDAERQALLDKDVGLLYVMGVNGQILMHFSAHIGQSWDEYLDAMRQGLEIHGPVRAGLYAIIKDRNP